MPKASWLSLRPAGAPEAAPSARSCLRLPRASASLGRSASMAALAWPAISALFSTPANLGQPRPLSRDGRAGRRYRPCFRPRCRDSRWSFSLPTQASSAPAWSDSASLCQPRPASASLGHPGSGEGVPCHPRLEAPSPWRTAALSAPEQSCGPCNPCNPCNLLEAPPPQTPLHCVWPPTPYHTQALRGGAAGRGARHAVPSHGLRREERGAAACRTAGHPQIFKKLLKSKVRSTVGLNGVAL